MSATSAINNGFDKSAGDDAGERFPRIGEINRAVISKIKEMYEHPAVIFGRWLGVSDKTAKRKLGLERALTVEDLGRLIRSERGFEIVAAIMADEKPAWWRIMVPLMDAADARTMQIAARRRVAKTIESVLDADRVLTAAIHRAEALAVHDEEHISPHLDALRSMGRVPNRPVAPSKGRRR